MLIGMRNALFGGAKLSAKSYVRDGLVMQYDGIENVGFGDHDSTATAWHDLTNNNSNAILVNRYAWGESFVYIYGKTYDTMIKIPGLPSMTDFTFEVVHRMDAKDNYARLWESEAYGQWHHRFAALFGTSMHPSNMSFVIGVDADVNYNLIPVSNVSRSFSVVPNVISQYSIATRVFVDGQFVQEMTPSMVASEIPTPTSYLDVGNRSKNPNRGFDGAVFAIRAYNRILTASEIATNYAIDKARFNLPDVT